jgi:hypothetical protein
VPFTCTFVHAAPPTVTLAPCRFVPVTVIVVPPAGGPESGAALETVGPLTVTAAAPVIVPSPRSVAVIVRLPDVFRMTPVNVCAPLSAATKV